MIYFTEEFFFSVDSFNLEYRWVKLSDTELLPEDVISIGCSTNQSGEDNSVLADRECYH